MQRPVISVSAVGLVLKAGAETANGNNRCNRSALMENWLLRGLRIADTERMMSKRDRSCPAVLNRFVYGCSVG